MAGKKRKAPTRKQNKAKKRKTDKPMSLESSLAPSGTNEPDVSQILSNGEIMKYKADLDFVPSLWFLDTVTSVSLCVDRNEVPLICGPVGCGKTSIIDYLARIRNAKTFRMQISEQTDTKALLGAYCCSNAPGVFIWRPGPLTHCMTAGKWLILEDVDKGSADLPILLSPILRNMKDSSSQVMHPNTGEPIPRHPDFRLILTRRTTSSPMGYSNYHSELDIYSNNCSVIYMNGMPADIIEQIIRKRNPNLVPLADRLLSDSPLLRRIAAPSGNDQRPVCSRDFFKFISRVCSIADGSKDSALDLYLNALDCFVCSQTSSSTRDDAAIHLGGLFNFSREAAIKIWQSRRPELHLNRALTRVEAGRAVIPIRKSINWELQLTKSSSAQVFADTRHACTLIERLAVAVSNSEPVLLVGETGTGKTSSIQRLALMAGRRLRVLNLNQQSDSVDLLGGFKPVDSRALVNPIREKFESLFIRTFRLESNRNFLGHIQACATAGRWRDLLTLLKYPATSAIRKLSALQNTEGENTTDKNDSSSGHQKKATLEEWQALLAELEALERRLSTSSQGSKNGGSNSTSLTFAFIEGALVRALEEGDWVLLDEINLAPPELLDCLAGLLDSSRGSVTLVDRGDLEPVQRHPDFHLFAAMNPSTDVGKRDLPMGLRNRFTEIRVAELEPAASVADREDLAFLIRTYLVTISPTAAQVSAVVQLYGALKRAANEGLVDGVGQRPCFSLRTLCRALTEASRGYHGSFIRSLYEGFLFSFGSQVGRASRPVLERMIESYLLTTTRQASGTKKNNEALARQFFSKPLPQPPLRDGDRGFVQVEGYWVPQGPLEILDEKDDAVRKSYVLTETVRGNLKDLARVVSAAGSLPVLLQGETSVGKTSLITYLAARVGQICHRINNHEHTDLQTYLGAYTAASASSVCTNSGDGSGVVSLVFQEGIFVQAMKQGHWIILDELNLAPTEILEALNRVLDENRELFITETQEMVKAHPHFRVFATQNPPGLYAGRKVLSRALRNRFVELHFDALPRAELEVILEHRSALPRSRASKMVEVMHQLQLIRRSSDIFQGKDGFITLRDLFRWGERYRLATCNQGKESQLFDWDTYLAEQGYLLLAGRARHFDEVKAVADVIQKVFKKKVLEENLYDKNEHTSAAAAEFLSVIDNPLGGEFDHIVWTRDMRRLLVLVGNALKYNEPILLVGETGCGKTTICQIFAAFRKQNLLCVNCHQYTEAADFLGGLRPVRTHRSDDPNITDDRLFEWVDGPLVVAMLQGEVFLLDEISLADDAVLERLNSLLEPERKICLTERYDDSPESEEITAAADFRLLATMNPGGDYAKKELSPALRNRFTEIWCPSPTFTVEKSEIEITDWQAIVEHNLRRSDLLAGLTPLAKAVVDFCWWFAQARVEVMYGGMARKGRCRRPFPTIRDLLAWLEFMHNLVLSKHDFSRASIFNACLHGAAFIFLDSLEVGENSPGDNIEEPYLFLDESSLQTSPDKLYKFSPVGGINFLLRCLLTHFEGKESDLHLIDDIKRAAQEFVMSLNLRPGQCVPELRDSNRLYGCEPFFIETGPEISPDKIICSRTPLTFSLNATTPASNLCRLLRALQLPKRALLLEGSPGVGKTSLVSALARAAGHRVVRINLSEATEASDLFGCDLPVEGAGCGTFAWRDGPLLQALRHGHWILLDEMNLASQSVLECLNACLDHRGCIYIPELGVTFHVKPRSTRLFACQNPVEEGGGRRALPKSFLNRFTQVYLKPLTAADQIAVLISIYNGLPVSHIEAMVKFNSMLQDAVERGDSFNAVVGTSWEFNLRDLCRWGDLLTAGQADFGVNPGLYVYLLYAARMRSNEDKAKVIEIWNCVAEETGVGRCYIPRGCTYPPIGNKLQIGLSTWYVNGAQSQHDSTADILLILNQHRLYLEMLLKILQHSWMSILIGPRGAGKRSLVHLAAQIVRRHVATVALSPSADTVELLGAFEQRENGGVFAWIDSPLVRGIREGHWVVLENAQLCSPSVLDRLNSLLEPGGDLLISERGLDANGDLVRLKPHPEFRLILVVDDNTAAVGSYSNNISRAMRNRGVEMVLTHDLRFLKEDLHRLLLSTGLPPDCVNALLIFESSVFQRLHALSSEVITTSMPPRKPPVGALVSAARMIQQIIASKELDTLMVSKVDEEITEDIAPWMVKWKGEDSRKKAFAKALIDVYARRQADRNVAQIFTKVICDFVDSELPSLLVSGQIHLQPRLNLANELLSSSISPLIDQWRYVLNHCSTVLSPSNNYFLPVLVRHSVERGFKIPSSAESLSMKEFASSIKDVDNMDLRWIPGWTCIANCTSSDLSAWNSRIVDAFLSTLKSFYGSVISTSSSQTFNEHIPVICALDHFVRGDIPIAFSEAYPGLQSLHSELLDALSGLGELFNNHGHGHLDFYGFLAALAKLTAWLQQFGSQPIGHASDWSERSEFFAHYCRSPQAGVATADKLMDLIHRHLQAPISKSMTAPKRLDLCHLPWTKLALVAHDQISIRLNPMDVNEVDTPIEVTELLSSETSESMRLWPVLATGLVFGRFRDASFTGWSENMSRNLLVELSIQLGALSRPRLLEIFTFSSERSSESITEILRLGNRAFSPLELSDPSGLVKPDLVHEWRSLSQAVLAVNHADSTSSHGDGANCSFADWISHQQTLSDLFQLLQKLARLSTRCQRISHRVDSEIPELMSLSRSLFCAILTAIHKSSRGRMSGDSPVIPNLSEVFAPLNDNNVEVFADTMNSYMGRFLVNQPSLLRLLRAFCACLKELSENRDEAVARAWVFYGALQMQCAFPASPLDPSIVNAFKIAIARDELHRLEMDLQIRAATRSIEVGSCGLPCINSNLPLPHTGCVDIETIQSNVEAGLEHPLVGAIVQRRVKVAKRLERLEERQVVRQDNTALLLRATSNSEYVELRRRLAAFNQNFTGDFLLKLLESGVSSRPAALQQWIETAASLSECFIQPQRLHIYADVVEPYLLGVAKVAHGLRTLVQLEISKDENATNFVSLVDSLSTGMFPTLATNTAVPIKGLPLTPCLQLIRHLVSPQIRGLLRGSIWKGYESDIDALSGRSIYIDARDVMAHRREVSLLRLAAEYRMNSYILDLIIMHSLSSASMAQHHVDFISRLLKALTGYLCLRWRRREARRKRDAERRTALFIEAEQRRRKCYDELQSAASAVSTPKNKKKKKKGETHAERRKRVQEAAEERELPDLIDAGLTDEVEWRLRFSEAGTIEARKVLSGDSDGFMGLRLSREDAIQQAVRSIEGVNSWFEQELANAEVETEAESEWLPGDEEVVGFVDRLVFILLYLPQRDSKNNVYASLAEKHWWRTFIEGYRFAGHLLAHSRYQLPATSDEYSMPSHLLATARLALTARDDSESVDLEKVFSFEPLQQSQKSESVMSVTRRKHCLDVYHDPIPKPEAKKAYAMMVAVRTRVLELLQEWPDHPALLKIITLINRMCTFSMNDCLTKYITAFEMLLAEMQEWEKNAARHVSLSEAFRSVCDLLIEWRKLELKCWMAALDASTETAANRCAPLWFHLQSVFLQPSISSTNTAEEDLCQILLEFMENGPVGEFPARWRLLAALYNAITIWPGLSDKQRLSARRMVGNVAWFYGQFIPHVNKFLLDEQKPIRKEMRNFISVMKWGDYNSFWTMKENVDKCKRTIHRHIRTWEGILRQSVKPCFDAAIKTSIEMPVSDTTLTISEQLQSIEENDFAVFKLSPEMKIWLSKLVEEREVSVNIRRLPVLIKRFKAHVIHISKKAPCLTWIHQLRECLVDWMERVKELSRSTQKLDSESPPEKALIAVLNEKETYEDSKSKDIDEEDLKKAKDWTSRYSALQQNKKLALHDWFRLSFGRRQLKFTSEALRTEDEPYLSDTSLNDLPLSDGEVSEDESDMCLGLSYRRGLRKSLFEKPRVQLISKLGGDLWTCSTNPPPVSIEHLEQLISSASISELQKVASESLARLLALRSGLPKHPEKSEIVDELGGRQGVEKLLGSLDDLLVNCADAFEPLGDLYSTFQKLKERVEEIHVTYNEGATSDSMIFRSRQFMRKLKASRDRIANLSCICIQQWNRFTETCSSLSTPPSQCLNRLLDANSDYFPLETTCNIPNVFADFKSRLEDLANRLDQRIPKSCIAITKNVIDQQEILKTAAQEFIQCCREISTRTGVDSTLLSGLLSVANSVNSEVEASNELVYTVQDLVNTVPSFENRVGSIISKTLVTLQCLKHLDESVEVERGMIDQLNGCTSALPESCISKLDVLTSSIDKLSPSCMNDVLYIQSITPLLASLLNAVSLRLRHLLAFLISWLGLGEFLAQVTFRLFNGGFCKPAALSKATAAGAAGKNGTDNGDGSSGANENEEGGCTSLNAEGVDTSGAKDVSKEVQSQEQIEGTADQQRNRGKDSNEPPPEADDNGIEMPDDFDGALDSGSGRDDEDPNKDDGQDRSEDDLQGVDERMGEAGDQPDELNQEMWASDDEEEEEEEKRENADLDESGVQDRVRSKSKSSKSTAVNEKPDDKSAESDAQDQEEEGEVNETCEDTTTGAKEKDSPSVENANKSETVAGSEDKDEQKDKNEKEMADAMKEDEIRLAVQEAELMQAEQNEGEEEGIDENSMDNFGENMSIEPNPEEFEDMDVPGEEIDLSAQPMEVEEEAEEEGGSGEIETDGATEPDKTNPPDDQMISNYNPGTGDLNTGNTEAYDQNPSEIESQDFVIRDEPEAAKEGTQDKEGQQQSQPGGSGKETGDFLTGIHSTPNRGNTTEPPTSRRKQQGPRPMSDQRTTTFGDKKNQQLLQQPEILEASTSGPTQKPEADGEGKVDAVQHIVDENASAPFTALDSATDAQQKEQQEEDVGISENADEKGENPGIDPNQLQSMPEEMGEAEIFESEPPPSALNKASNQDRDVDSSNSAGNEVPTLPKLDMELIATQGAQRPSNSTFNTILPPSTLSDVPSQGLQPLPPPYMRRQFVNSEKERELVASASLNWRDCVARSSGFSVQLCEALRLVLEPTRASRMKGDFRTGKRLNMRKARIIPYLASQFRKDKIWMRRTQPNQRDYRILIAVDNSSSMADNLCKHMTFEALATVINALNLLEAGKIGVCSFGESVEVVHGMGEPWTNEIGASMLAQFDFKQSRTSLIQLLQTSVSLMQTAGEGSASSRGVPASQLLLILSDGVFSEDPQSPALQAAVRLARDHHLFVVCVIIDDSKKKHSIFDLRRYTGQGKLLPYMDVFPLPFYLVLRDVTALPQLLAEALRQWFELASATAERSGSS